MLRPRDESALWRPGALAVDLPNAASRPPCALVSAGLRRALLCGDFERLP